VLGQRFLGNTDWCVFCVLHIVLSCVDLFMFACILRLLPAFACIASACSVTDTPHIGDSAPLGVLAFVREGQQSATATTTV
ncbi:hypothetical protein BGY98DRAFT_951407, partial [Russula aff. rugulosa BPL654]